jgi:hypothetical protein
MPTTTTTLHRFIASFMEEPLRHLESLATIALEIRWICQLFPSSTGWPPGKTCSGLLIAVTPPRRQP